MQVFSGPSPSVGQQSEFTLILSLHRMMVDELLAGLGGRIKMLSYQWRRTSRTMINSVESEDNGYKEKTATVRALAFRRNVTHGCRFRLPFFASGLVSFEFLDSGASARTT